MSSFFQETKLQVRTKSCRWGSREQWWESRMKKRRSKRQMMWRWQREWAGCIKPKEQTRRQGREQHRWVLLNHHVVQLLQSGPVWFSHNQYLWSVSFLLIWLSNWFYFLFYFTVRRSWVWIHWPAGAKLCLMFTCSSHAIMHSLPILCIPPRVQSHACSICVSPAIDLQLALGSACQLQWKMTKIEQSRAEENQAK